MGLVDRVTHPDTLLLGACLVVDILNSSRRRLLDFDLSRVWDMFKL